MPLHALIDCAGTAYWRRGKAKQFPDDQRNLRAAAELEELAGELAPLEGSDLHVDLDRLVSEGSDDLMLARMELIGILLRRIGFSLSFSSGRELLQHVIDRCSEEHE
jgi:hypothetical protein